MKIDKIINVLVMGLAAAHDRIAATARGRPETEKAGEDGCYTLADGTLIPLGDLGVRPQEYDLQP